MTNMYPERWVRAICTKLYGSPIANRTWRKYKHICKVPDGRKLASTDEIMISKTHCQWLMMLAYIRCEQKRGDKPPVGWKSGVTLKQIITRLNESRVKLALDQAMGDEIILEGLKGSDVPLWLNKQVGRSPHVKTLRRWAKKHGLEFHTHLPVPSKTLDVFLKIA
ncbi:MAG: hypothetical protein RLZZ184_102 [Cyanobacteriota bacterium]